MTMPATPPTPPAAPAAATATPDPAAPFVLDTSSWIEAYNEHYRPSVFQRLWQDMPGLVADGRLALAEAAYREVTHTDDDLKRWMVALRQHVVANNQSIEAQHAAIQSHPMGVALILKGAATPRSDADSRIIATAMYLRGTVVTKEKPSNSPRKPKIPNVCAHFRVPCVNMMEMLELLGLRY
jgi:predicted nucleic acid-binding protein